MQVGKPVKQAPATQSKRGGCEDLPQQPAEGGEEPPQTLLWGEPAEGMEASKGVESEQRN